MQLSIDIGYNEVVSFIRQLPKEDVKKINYIIEHEILNQNQNEPNELQKLLLQGPVWSDERYEEYLEVREYINSFKPL